jgi:hypothetical protein
MEKARLVDTGYSRLIRKLAAASGRPVKLELKTEGVRLLRQIINYTPPSVNKANAALLKANNTSFKTAGAMRIGKQAILGDFGRAVGTFATKSEAKHPLLIKALSTKDPKIFEAFLKTSGSSLKAVSGQEIASHHKSARNRRGRVPRSTGAVTLDVKQWQRHYRTLTGRIGFMKSGWLRGWETLRGGEGWRELPGFIRKHSSYAKGYAVVQSSRDGLAITMINQTPGVGVMQNAVNGAMATRARALSRRISYLLKRQLR